MKESIRRNLQPLVVAGIAALIVTLDQLSKWWVLSNLPGEQPFNVIDGFLRLRYVENTGAAFGLFQGWAGALSIVAVAVIVAILFSASKLGHTSKAGTLAVALLVGGALGNLVDRVRLGYVVDFVDVYGPHFDIGGSRYSFPVFNVADSSITVGAILLAIVILFAKPAPETPARADAAAQPEEAQADARPSAGARPARATPAGWAGLLAMLGGLFLMALRLANKRE